MEKPKVDEDVNPVNPLILDFFKQFSGVTGVDVKTVGRAMMAYIDSSIAERIKIVAKEHGLVGQVGDFEISARIKAAEKIFLENTQK